MPPQFVMLYVKSKKNDEAEPRPLPKPNNDQRCDLCQSNLRISRLF